MRKPAPPPVFVYGLNRADMPVWVPGAVVPHGVFLWPQVTGSVERGAWQDFTRTNVGTLLLSAPALRAMGSGRTAGAA
ncbi:hypothetical protein [Pandoraea oxalativorans]|uniref:Uncharacterized protein n=1 Tax=Pandoraea oxalativorans TaxID=573737 RepID=A0A0G3IFN3_9BURK|nr:hypothetical protein [Pandoraea oxalativorans]AKK24721.1 hypothetical protein MB84_28315 [Pandoraea oxalativorans]